ncbi:hypothetical protein CBR_g62611 [Chara braunii]|uniref:Uncharacterized protein n=1 Tax=Chara braunii TaxID=69332 RepID=A0A388MFE0_CHABU|nr:hypothetical protein CBR_g62611 [Chara braunii]|eukprot:GBG93270.1 hypothetical protein CBR_g62611 [Chara braunii]
MMSLTFAMAGTLPDWTLVVPKPEYDVFDHEVEDQLAHDIGELNLSAKRLTSTLYFAGDFSNIHVMDRECGTLSPLTKADIFRNWDFRKLRASFGIKFRLGRERAIEVLSKFFMRNRFCVITKWSGRGEIEVVDRSMIVKALDHWALGELLAFLATEKSSGRSMIGLNQEEIKQVKELSRKEASEWFGRARCKFLALGGMIGCVGGFDMKFPLIEHLIKGFEPKKWEGEGVDEMREGLVCELWKYNPTVRKAMQLMEKEPG